MSILDIFIISVYMLSAQPVNFSKPTKFSILSTSQLKGLGGSLLVPTSDGGALIYGKFVNNRGFLSKVSRLGDVQWEKQLNPDTCIEVSNIVETPDNNYHISGYTALTSDGVMLARMRYAAIVSKSGDLVWKIPTDTSAKKYIEDNCPVIICRNGQYAVLSYPGLNVFTMKRQPFLRFYTEKGEIIRDVPQDSLHSEIMYVRSFFQTKDGGFGALIHTRLDLATSQQLWRFDSTGKLLWKKDWADVQYSNVSFYSSAIETKDSTIVVVTTATTSLDTTFVNFKRFNPKGDLLYKRQLGLRYYNTVSQIVETPGQDLILVGSTTDKRPQNSPYINYDIYLARMKYDGKIKWQEAFGDSTSGDYGTCIGVIDEHSFYISGSTGKTDNEFTPGQPILFKISDAVTGIEEEAINPHTAITLTPQPANAEATLTFTTESTAKSSVKITNLLGIDVISPIEYQAQTGVNTLHLPTGGLPSGVYIVSIYSDKGFISKKLSIAH